ncbi:MAG: peptidyl-prolyl cis-trans isomerase [Gammaproteobacteria bacterium]|nr:MAG: peptidyl-prolyl cis-trans isomerase [Gammaproteobacteria bacterium]
MIAIASRPLQAAVAAFALLIAPPLTAEAPLPNFPKVEFTTTLGNFTVELDTRRAPHTVRNFLGLVADGHYEGLIFHRVIQGFVVQGGGYTPDFDLRPVADEVINESGNGLSNRRGTIAMARTNEPHSANSQFYINLVDNLSLDPQPSRWGYTVFGSVVAGMETVDAIGGVATASGGPFERDVPQAPVIITGARLVNGGGG